jgi:hypothetical protein
MGLPPPSEEGDAALIQQASDISLAISNVQSFSPGGTGGGTPTGPTLTSLQGYSDLQDPDREDFALLLTDGLPNCNENNPLDYTVDADACQCTLASPGQCTAEPKRGCLDLPATVAATQALLGAGVKTIVIGFGAETGTGSAPQVLNEVALAGGFPRTCPNGANSECGLNDTCNVATKTCNQAYYQAGNSAQLLGVLGAIRDRVVVGDPCVRQLEAIPSDPALLVVSINGAGIDPGADTWTYDSGIVRFHGALCTQLQNSTSVSPALVEYRILQIL